MYIGYENYSTEVTIKPGDMLKIEIPMEPSAIQLKETRVTAKKRQDKVTEAPASIEIISERDIKRETTTNLGSFLKGLKGVDFTSSGINNYSISVRGFNSSFSTRLLTLTDGRVANIPALRVINYSTIPQSTDDIENIEVVLGPATALYGANAHSGVVNITSKSPANSEGFSFSVSGSNDDRQMQKYNARFAKKLTNSLSIKLSGMYLHAYEWPFISENEYKRHKYPWVGTPGRAKDGADNNPWTGGLLGADGVYSANDTSFYWTWGFNANGDSIHVGDGEQNDTGDPDGDGFQGEDWVNGVDDDGDGLIDEDFFFADGIDNDNDGNIDENIDHATDQWYDGLDNDGDGNIDDSQERETGNGTGLPQWQYNMEDRNIIIEGGRIYQSIDGELNQWFSEENFLSEPFADVNGDGVWNPEDSYEDNTTHFLGNDGVWDADNCNEDGSVNSWGDFNNDGICNGETLISDFNGNGIWDASEDFIDLNEDGVFNTYEDYIDLNNNSEWDENEPFTDNNGNDIYDFPVIIDEHVRGDFYYDENKQELLFDLFLYDSNGDGVLDTGDGCFGCPAEEFIDTNGNGRWDSFIDINNNGLQDDFEENSAEVWFDTNLDGKYTPADYKDEFQTVTDNNGDGLDEYPDFEVDNRKVEFRLDYDPNMDFNLSYQTGYSWTKTQQVTGTGRYLADGFEYRFHQLRGRLKNWFVQGYTNQSNSGDTRSYLLGNVIRDQSVNYAFQIQNNFDTNPILEKAQNFMNQTEGLFQYNYDKKEYEPWLIFELIGQTKVVWGIDYFRTEPITNGSILNDGPNGYDNDGDFNFISTNGIDDDGDSDDYFDENGNGKPDIGEPGVNDQGFVYDNNVDDDGDGEVDENIDEIYCDDGFQGGMKDGKFWKCGEGIDEEDEFDYVVSNELGVYFQTKTNLYNSQKWELITAARFDHHDMLDEGIQFSPKIGLIYKPNDISAWRFTYGKAFNTPSAITLHTDLFVARDGILEIYLRGNADGTPYPRADENYQVSAPGYYEDGEFIHIGADIIDDNYGDRVTGAPFFFNLQDSSVPTDMIPIDTARYLIYVPELNDDGVLYTPEETLNISDVDPIGTEKIQTVELGHKGFLGERTHFSVDYYISYYEDFFSPPTVITPLVVKRLFDEEGNDITTVDNLEVMGLMPVNDYGTNPPYGTAWNGLDDDGDWEEYAPYFGWDLDDDDGDGNYADPYEWGFVDPFTPYDNDGDGVEESFKIYNPEDIMEDSDGQFAFFDIDNSIVQGFLSVGVDEYSSVTGQSEAELIETAIIGDDGEPLLGPGRAYAPPHMVLSPMNYGNVWMQGLDLGITQFMPEYNLVMDANFSWYGTTEYYNELTKKNDPINAPKFKMNASIKWDAPFGAIALNYRHVDKFEWKDGIWAGFIGPYDLIDLHYNYQLNEYVELSLSASNIFNDVHKEMVGGAEMGRQIIMRMSSSF